MKIIYKYFSKFIYDFNLNFSNKEIDLDYDNIHAMPYLKYNELISEYLDHFNMDKIIDILNIKEFNNE